MSDCDDGAPTATLRRWLAVVVLWLVIAGVALVQFWPVTPHSGSQWLVFLLAAPPLYLGMEWLAERLLPRQRSSCWGTRVSPGRIAIGTLVLLLLLFMGSLFAQILR